jgi:hypothetical protein
MRSFAKPHTKVAIVTPLPREECCVAGSGNISDGRGCAKKHGLSPLILRQSALIDVDVAAAALPVFTGLKKKSAEFISSAKFHRLSQLITSFIGEVIGMLSKGESEKVCSLEV